MNSSSILIGDQERRNRTPASKPPEEPQDEEKLNFWKCSPSILAVLSFALTLVTLTLGLAFAQYKINTTMLSDDAVATAKFKDYDRLVILRTEQNTRLESKLDAQAQRLDGIERKQDKMLELLFQLKH